MNIWTSVSTRSEESKIVGRNLSPVEALGQRSVMLEYIVSALGDKGCARVAQELSVT